MPSDSPAANVPSAPGLPGRSAPLDTTLVLVSPENIAFEYRLAGPAPRAIAFLIDLMLLVAVGGLTPLQKARAARADKQKQAEAMIF